MRKVSLGLIGLGHMGEIHLYNALRIGRTTVKGVADTSKKSLKLARRWGVSQVYTDYEELLRDRDIDAVVIAVPPFLHRECAERTAEAGKHIFIEKPLARNVSEAAQILSRAARSNVRIMVGNNLRFFAPFLTLKKQIELGRFGDVQLAEVLCLGSGPFFERGGIPRPVPEWWFNKELSGGGVLLDLGCHAVNLLRWYFGEPRVVNSFLGHRFHMDLEDYAVCFLRFRNNICAVLSVGWFSSSPFTEVTMAGTAKCLTTSMHANMSGDYFLQSILRRIHGKPLIPHAYDTYYDEIEHFAGCIESDTEFSMTGEEGLADLKVISTAYDSASPLGDGRDNHDTSGIADKL